MRGRRPPMFRRSNARWLALLFPWCLAFGFGACQEETPPPERGEPEEVRRVLTGFIAAYNGGDLEAVLDYYTADAILLPPDGEPLEGREAVRTYYAKLFETFAFEVSFKSAESRVAGAWAFDRGVTSGLVIEKESGASIEVRDNYLMILRHRADAGWRIARLIWNRAGP